MFEGNHYLALHIPGTRKNIEETTNEARLINCFNLTEYNIVLDKIFKYISI
jgi:hypothetical protein